jgi:hypothetical protein
MTKKTESAKPHTPTKKPATTPENVDRGAPIEKYRGEITDGSRVGDPGDLEEETLDRDAPFNKSYGTRDEDGSGPQR